MPMLTNSSFLSLPTLPLGAAAAGMPAAPAPAAGSVGLPLGMGPPPGMGAGALGTNPPGAVPGTAGYQPYPGMTGGFTAGTTGGGLSAAVPVAVPGVTPQATRHARRAYVGGLPMGSNEATVAMFFSNALAAIGGVSAIPGEPVLNVYMNQEKKFAFVEFRSVEETSNAMALDSVLMEGVSLRVRRPNDYQPAIAASLGPSAPSPNLNLAAIGLTAGGNSGGGGSNLSAIPEDQTNRLFIGGLPYFLTDVMVKELIEAFGPVKSFQLIVDRETGKSKGYGFFVYADESVTDVAMQGLHGMQMGEKTLTVRRANQRGAAAGAPAGAPAAGAGAVLGAGLGGMAAGVTDAAAALHAQVQAHLAGVAGAGVPAGAGVVPGMAAVPPPPPANPPSTVLALTEMLDVEELRDDTEYAEIMEDMREECGKFGEVLSIVIPRPAAPGSAEHVPGLGKVFVQYADIPGATAARDALHGRKFGGHVVKADYLDENAFISRAFS